MFEGMAHLYKFLCLKKITNYITDLIPDSTNKLKIS